jgi:hypothetical protein
MSSSSTSTFSRTSGREPCARIGSTTSMMGTFFDPSSTMIISITSFADAEKLFHRRICDFITSPWL